MSIRDFCFRLLRLIRRLVLSAFDEAVRRIERAFVDPFARVLYPDRPVAVVSTPASVLARDGTPANLGLYIGRRRRVATCTGLAWFHDRYLATVNLSSSAIHVYRHDQVEDSLVLAQSLDGLPEVKYPDNIACSPDGRLLALTNSTDGKVNLFRLDTESHRIVPEVVATLHCAGDRNPHGIAFSPCSTILAYSTVDEPGVIRLFRIEIDRAAGVRATPFQVIENRFAPMKPKGIDFHPSGRFVAVAYGPNASREPRRSARAFVAIYAFDPVEGLIQTPVSRSDPALRLRCTDDVRCFPNGLRLLVPDQDSDRAFVLAFDPETGGIGRTELQLCNPNAGLSTPHGCAVAPNGRHFGITNYGNDSARIFRLP